MVVCGWVLESSEGAVVGGSNLRFSPTFHGIHTRGAESELFTCSRPLKFESRALLEDSTALFLHQPDRD